MNAFGYIFPAAVRAASSTADNNVLVSCAGELAKLALYLNYCKDFYQGQGWCVGNTGLDALAVQAVLEATVSC